MSLRTLVLPVAGRGARLRPLTDKTPKNLLQLGGIPIIEYALREARQCGIKRIVLITNPSNIGDFKKYIRHAAPRFPDMEFFIRIQEKPLGNGHAVLQALDLFKNEPIAVRFSDDILVHENPVLEQMMDFSQNLQGSVVLLDRIPRENVSRYGVVKSEPVEKEGKRLHRLFGAVEKPRIEDAPSNLIIVGAYILTPAVISDLLDLAAKLDHRDDALPITSALEKEIAKGGKVFGWEFPGIRLDCGTIEEFEKAQKFMTDKSTQDRNAKLPFSVFPGSSS